MAECPCGAEPKFAARGRFMCTLHASDVVEVSKTVDCIRGSCRSAATHMYRGAPYCSAHIIYQRATAATQHGVVVIANKDVMTKGFKNFFPEWYTSLNPKYMGPVYDKNKQFLCTNLWNLETACSILAGDIDDNKELNDVWHERYKQLVAMTEPSPPHHAKIVGWAHVKHSKPRRLSVWEFRQMYAYYYDKLAFGTDDFGDLREFVRKGGNIQLVVPSSHISGSKATVADHFKDEAYPWSFPDVLACMLSFDDPMELPWFSPEVLLGLGITHPVIESRRIQAAFDHECKEQKKKSKTDDK